MTTPLGSVHSHDKAATATNVAPSPSSIPQTSWPTPTGIRISPPSSGSSTTSTHAAPKPGYCATPPRWPSTSQTRRTPPPAQPKPSARTGRSRHLHYRRDVTLGEGRSRIRTNPGVFARLHSFAFNILKANRHAQPGPLLRQPRRHREATQNARCLIALNSPGRLPAHRRAHRHVASPCRAPEYQHRGSRTKEREEHSTSNHTIEVHQRPSESQSMRWDLLRQGSQPGWGLLRAQVGTLAGGSQEAVP